MVLTPEWVSDGTDLVLMTTSAQKADGKEMKKKELSQSLFQFIARISREVKWSFTLLPHFKKEFLSTPP